MADMADSELDGTDGIRNTVVATLHYNEISKAILISNKLLHIDYLDRVTERNNALDALRRRLADLQYKRSILSVDVNSRRLKITVATSWVYAAEHIRVLQDAQAADEELLGRISIELASVTDEYNVLNATPYPLPEHYDPPPFCARTYNNGFASTPLMDDLSNLASNDTITLE
jgi:hypothetical protein